MSASSSELKILCDENVPKKLVELLKTEKFDVKRVNRGVDDESVSRIAKSEGRVILSFDRHFGNILLFPPEKYSGIVFIRIHPPLIKTAFSALMNLFRSVEPLEFKGRLFTLSLFGFRVYSRSSTK